MLLLSMDAATTQFQELLVESVRAAVRDASARGWEAVVLVLVMLGLILLTGLIIKWLIKSMDKRLDESREREKRMEERLTAQEAFSQTTLLKVVNDSSALSARVLVAVEALTASLTHKPCLLDSTQQAVFVDRIADRVGEHLIDQNCRQS